jgi:hypothetical protein
MSIEKQTLDHAAQCLELAKKLLGHIDSYKEIVDLQKKIIDNLGQQNDILQRQLTALGEAICPHG